MIKNRNTINRRFVIILKKIKNFIYSLQTVGLKGMINLAKTKTAKISTQNLLSDVADLQKSSPLFRYATCNDMVWLMAQYPEYCRDDRDSTRSTTWGLKSAGTLFCVNKIIQLNPKKILEVGPGWNLHFDKHFGADHDYWIIDDATDIGWDQNSLKKFEAAVGERKHTSFVRGFMGSFQNQLEDKCFDLVFSISVVEHVPAEKKRDFYRDIYRVLKPGGYMAHSIDIFDETLARAEFEVIKETGFIIPSKPDLQVRVKPSEGNPTLFEDMWTVFHSYLGINRPDKWENLREIPGHQATLFVFAQKPA